MKAVLLIDHGSRRDAANEMMNCMAAGATELIVFPYMLSPGKHSTGDIPRMVGEAAAPYPRLVVRVTTAFGVHEKLGEIILARAGLPVANPLSADEATRCWHSSQSGTACGDACRCHPVSESVTSARSVVAAD